MFTAGLPKTVQICDLDDELTEVMQATLVTTDQRLAGRNRAPVRDRRDQRSLVSVARYSAAAR